MSFVQSEATAIINVHREGALLTPTLRSLVRAKDVAAVQGFHVRFDVVADRPDQRTMDIVDQFSDHIDKIEEVEYGNLTLSRDHGVQRAQTDFVFLHDGDDLYSSNWYSALWQRMQQGGVDDNTVYHTRLFARFGDLYDVFKTPDSTGMSFDPHSLLLDWFYSNKCAFHRILVERYTIPPIDKARGLGNEDWSWSADTIADGVRHTYLPDTICFYRVKPSHLSLGAAKGVMQSPSPLFEASHIAQDQTKRDKAPLSQLTPNTGLDTKTLTAWPAELLGDIFDTELATQSEFEPLLTQFPRRGYTGQSPVQEKPQYPLLGRFYRKLRLRLGDDDLDVLWLPKHLPFPKDHLLDWATEAIALDAPGLDTPPRLIFFEDFEDPEIMIELDRWNGVGINLARLDASGIYGDYQKTRFLMRFLMQNRVRYSIDFGSPTLSRITRDFPAAYCHFAPHHITILPQRRLDWYDPALSAGVLTAHTVAQQSQTRCPVIAFAPDIHEGLASDSLQLLSDGHDLLSAADAMNDARLALFHMSAEDAAARTPQEAKQGPALLAQMFAQARTPIPVAPIQPTAGGTITRDAVTDVRSEGVITNQHFLNAGPWLLSKNDDKAIVLPCNIFFRLDDRDHAMWLPFNTPADSVARLVDLIAKNPAADFPIMMTVRSTEIDIIKDLASAKTPIEAYLKLAVDYSDKVLIAQESVVLPGITSW